MAFIRTLETLRPARKRLFSDALAAVFLRPSLKLALQVARLPVIGQGLPIYMDRRWPGARSSGVARTRLIDDLMIEAFTNGFEQVVILGAGFDARAHRLPHPAAIRFFEVDQPSTPQAKRCLLEKRFGELPSHVAFVEVDFNRQGLGPTLEHAGFRPQQAAFFLWEGVTNYLTEEAVDATLRRVGGCAAGSQLAFTSGVHHIVGVTLYVQVGAG
jgi:methyltransferase (TIGR00027 family)